MILLDSGFHRSDECAVVQSFPNGFYPKPYSLEKSNVAK